MTTISGQFLRGEQDNSIGLAFGREMPGNARLAEAFEEITESRRIIDEALAALQDKTLHREGA